MSNVMNTNEFILEQIANDIGNCEYLLDAYEARILRAKRLAAIDVEQAEQQLARYTRLINEEKKNLSTLKQEQTMWSND